VDHKEQHLETRPVPRKEAAVVERRKEKHWAVARLGAQWEELGSWLLGRGEVNLLAKKSRQELSSP
jgi:hypothetical protein